MVRRRLFAAASLATLIGLALRGSSRADAPPLPVEQPPIEDPAIEAAPVPDAPPPAYVERFFPFLDDEDPSASISVGDTSHGFLINARQLVENDTVGILARQRERDLAWGTDEIVAMIDHAGRTLHEKTGTRLWIGDIGRRG